MDYKISSDGSTAVSTTQEWLPMEDCPTNTKVRLLTEGRVSVPGSVTLQTLKNYVAWAPEPKEPAWLKEKLKIGAKQKVERRDRSEWNSGDLMAAMMRDGAGS